MAIKDGHLRALEGWGLSLRPWQIFRCMILQFVSCDQSRARVSREVPSNFRDVAEPPWFHICGSQLVGPFHRLSQMPEGNLHLDIFKDITVDLPWWQQSAWSTWSSWTMGQLPRGNLGNQKQFSSMSLGPPFKATETSSINGVEQSGDFREGLDEKQQREWDLLHEAPRQSTSRNSKLPPPPPPPPARSHHSNRYVLPQCPESGTPTCNDVCHQ